MKKYLYIFLACLLIGIGGLALVERDNINANLTSQLEQQERTYSGRIDELTAYQESLVAKLNTLQSNYSKLEIGYNNLQQTYEAYIAENELKIENLQSEISDIKNTVSELEAQSEIDQAKIAELKTQISNLEKSISEKNVTIDELTATINAQKATIAELQSTINDLTADLNSDIAPLLISGDNNGETITLTADRLGNISKVRAYAFYNVKNPLIVELPDSCTSIGMSAFAYSGLTNISGQKVAGGLMGTFTGCSNLTSVELPCINGIYEASSHMSGLFQDCSSLERISLPELTTIDNYCYDTFGGCVNLKSIDFPKLTSLPEYVIPYEGLANLQEVNLPLVTAIPNRCFNNCSNLTTVHFGTLETIGEGAFSGTKLSSFDFGNIKEIPSNAFYQTEFTTLNLPEGLEIIGDSAFTFTPLTTINFPEGLKSIGSKAFARCLISEVVIPDSCTSIGNGAFSLCPNLETVVTPNCPSIPNVFSHYSSGSSDIPLIVNNINTRYSTDYSNEVFYSNNSYRLYPTSLKSITITKGEFKSATGVFSLTYLDISNCTWNAESCALMQLKSIENLILPTEWSLTENLFYESKITSITIPDGTTIIPNSCFYNCEYLTNVTLSNTVEEVGRYCFAGCKKLTTINFPSSLRIIGYRAFASCNSLVNIEFNEGLTTIDGCALEGDNLPIRNIVLPSTITTIGEDVFNGHPSLTLTIKAITPPTLVSGILINYSYMTAIYVPAESVEAYKTANIWSQYSDKIFAIEGDSSDINDPWLKVF